MARLRHHAPPLPRESTDVRQRRVRAHSINCAQLEVWRLTGTQFFHRARPQGSIAHHRFGCFNQAGLSVTLSGILVAAITVALAITASTSAASPYPSLDIHGMIYESACIDSTWKETHDLLAAASKGNSSSDLIKLVRTWLCESGPRANEVVRSSAPSRIRITSEQTGIIGQERGYLSRSSVHALGGQVWGVIVEQSADNVRVSYYPNEACVAAGTFAYRHGKWLFASMSEACD